MACRSDLWNWSGVEVGESLRWQIENNSGHSQKKEKINLYHDQVLVDTAIGELVCSKRLAAYTRLCCYYQQPDLAL